MNKKILELLLVFIMLPFIGCGHKDKLIDSSQQIVNASKNDEDKLIEAFLIYFTGTSNLEGLRDLLQSGISVTCSPTKPM